jgi:ammonia channel protein AmtB
MGAIAGLVMIPPAAGFIEITTSLSPLACLVLILCRQALRIKFTDLVCHFSMGR